jgi:hypothetical protein
MAMNQFIMARDANNMPDGQVLIPPKYVDAYVLVGGAEATAVTKPTGARVAIFSSTGNFYLSWAGTAATPAVSITDGTGPELNPVARDVSGDTAWSIQAPDACVVTIAYFT